MNRPVDQDRPAANPSASLDLVVADAPPTVAEYIALRRACGLGDRTEDAARRGLAGGLHTVCLRHDGNLVGMGRVVGDGGCFAQIVDIAVRPDWQRRGLGRRIVFLLMNWCQTALPASCYLSLIADPAGVGLYKAAGFIARPPAAPGMGLTLTGRLAGGNQATEH